MHDSDPFSAAIAPPHNESVEERERRFLEERAAKQVSDRIDEQINKDWQQRKKEGNPVKILLLGQRKSTTLKNFQLMCEPKTFRAERASWRAIIHLNIVHSLRIILDAIARASNPRSSTSSNDSLPLDADLDALRLQLLPLLQIEDILVRRLATSSPDIAPTSSMWRAGKEVAIHSAVAWKGVFIRAQEDDNRQSFDTQNVVNWDDPDDPGRELNAHSAAMKRLWQHSDIQRLMEKEGIRLQESPGFFLDSLDEMTAARYVPTDEHILRARLKTLGVSEHRLRLTDPHGIIGRDFHIFDVGGERSMRPKWAPYFMDMDAIIFLAPISAFDQTLVEDPSVNRLVRDPVTICLASPSFYLTQADSLALWTTITSNKLLQKSNLILFLNKIDIVQAKLSAGIRLAQYLAAYGRRPNDFDSASKYLKKQFNAILKQISPEPRTFYCHLTNVVDNTGTSFILGGIKDMLMRTHLKDSYLIL
ncbi:guanine nucleotide binding protein, alpha subunit [Mycena rebaudengoi]|nr:guanine nucleotide binding protein, alpha subunit [Mycena rebaudengoi]